MKISFDTYTIYARFFPALVSSVPLFILWFFISPIGEMEDLITYLFSIKFFGGLTFSIILLYLFSQLTRTASKMLENKYFINANGFPTTYLLMYKDHNYSTAYKDAFRGKVSNTFGVILPTKIEETDNFLESKKRLTEITKQLILHVGAGKLVQKHNIWYGFFRNLLGGCYFSVFFCLINIGLGYFWLNKPTLSILSAILFLFFITMILAQKLILIQHAEAYAKQLIAEFMS